MESYGYRFDTPDRSIVISEILIPHRRRSTPAAVCDDADSRSTLPSVVGDAPGTFQKFAAKYHTDDDPANRSGTSAKPRLLILYHYVGLSPEELHDEMRDQYAGAFRDRSRSRCLLNEHRQLDHATRGRSHLYPQ
jgi:hypothetical protein